MPLPPPANRRHLHQRDIRLQGFEREDGLFDIEAELADTKTYGFDNDDRGHIAPGEKLHGMTMRMTVDDAMKIVACEAATDYAPYTICPTGAVNFTRLAGLTIGPGFLRAAAERVGGTNGCTHLRELLQQVATVAFQTILPVVSRRRAAVTGTPHKGIALLNSCAAYATNSPVVKRRWPEKYTGS